MNPYVITVERELGLGRHEIVSRRAVSTLGGARELVAEYVANVASSPRRFAEICVAESGGSIALADGTAINVEQVADDWFQNVLADIGLVDAQDLVATFVASYNNDESRPVGGRLSVARAAKRETGGAKSSPPDVPA